MAELGTPLALSIRPLDVATPLLQATRVRQQEMEAQQAQFQMRQQALGAEVRSIVPYANSPEFGQRWAESFDRQLQQGLIDPQTHAKMRDNPSTLALSSALARVETPEIGLQRQRMTLQQDAVNRHAPAFGLPQTQVPGAIPSASAQPSYLPAPAAPTTGPRPGGPVQSSATVMGDAEGERLGIYPPTGGAPAAAQPLPATVAPVAPAPARPAGNRNPASADLQRYIAAAADPNLPESMRNVSLEFVKRELANSTLTNDQKDYALAQASGDPAAQRPFTEWLRTSKRDSPETDAASRRRAVLAEGGNPNDPHTRQFILSGKMPREDQQPLSASDRKAILEADEAVSSANGAIQALNRAKVLSKTALGFRGASLVAEAGALGGSQTSLDTIEMNNVIQTNALAQLKAIFGGNPTEGERKILLDIQGSSSLPHAARVRIFDLAIQATNRRLEMNQQRSNELRGRTFYLPGGGQSQAPANPSASAIAEARSAIAAGASRDAVIQRLRANNIDPAGL